ncbi:MAG: hypothetical protein U0269_36685 [Polyangiales bacterium]
MAHACYVCSFYPVPDGEGVECPHCHRLQYGNKCPHCGQSAPTRVRDFRVYCTACNRERGALSGSGLTMPISMVGKPSQIGGIASKIIGGGVIGLTLLLVTLVTLAAVSFSSTVLGALAVLLAMFGGVVGFLLLRGGKKLEQQGTKAQHDVREQALIAAARTRGGILTAAEAAAVLEIQVGEADALLTQIAKEGQRAHVEVDRDGVVKYVFHEAAPVHVAPTTAVQDATGVRVDVNAPTQYGAAVDHKEAARQQVDREFEELKKTRAAKGE